MTALPDQPADTNEKTHYQLAISFPDGEVERIGSYDNEPTPVQIAHGFAEIEDLVVKARKQFRVGPEYRPELLIRRIITFTNDWETVPACPS